MNEIEIIKKKVEYFQNNNLLVHLELKNTRYLNGKILEFSGDLLMIDDRVIGVTPVYIFEIKIIEPFREGGK